MHSERFDDDGFGCECALTVQPMMVLENVAMKNVSRRGIETASENESESGMIGGVGS